MSRQKRAQESYGRALESEGAKSRLAQLKAHRDGFWLGACFGLGLGLLLGWWLL